MTKTPMELADEIERLHLQFEEAKNESIEDRAVPAAKLQATLMVNRVEIIAALRSLAADAKDAENFRYLEGIIEWKPKAYDGCSYGRFDLMWPNEEPDLRKAIEARRR